MSESISFESAIAATEVLLKQIEQQQISDAELQAQVTDLVRTRNGARGFFVAYLTNAADTLTPAPILQSIQTASDVTSELLVKNLVMSTAMVLTHTRNQNPELAAQSQRVQQRTAQILPQVMTPQLEQEVQDLWQSFHGEGGYSTFLKKWGYDAEQQQAMAAQLQQVFPELCA